MTTHLRFQVNPSTFTRCLVKQDKMHLKHAIKSCYQDRNSGDQNHNSGLYSSAGVPGNGEVQREGYNYSGEWADYYRAIGKHEAAEAIEAQMRAIQEMRGAGGAGPSPTASFF